MITPYQILRCVITGAVLFGAGVVALAFRDGLAAAMLLVGLFFFLDATYER